MKKLFTLILVVVIMTTLAVAVNAAFGVVVEAQKVDKQPNLEEIDESWGEPVLTGITSASENTYLWKYWTEYQINFRYNNPTAPDYIRYGDSPPPGIEDVVPEDNPMDLYMCWDDKYFYFGVATYDYEVAGWVNKHRGDGIQLQFQPIETVEDPTYGANENVHVYDPYNLLWTLAFDDWSVDTEYYTADLEEVPVITQLDDDEIHFIIAIPLQQYGYNKKNLVDGVEFAIAFMRVSSKSSFDWGYAGGVCWGKYLRESIDVEGPMTATSLNTVILRDPATATEPPATEAPATEAPETEAPETEAPATEAPATEAPATEAPATEAPATEAPATEAPATEAPATEAPATEAPATEAPATEAPATEAPATEAPATEAPATEAPATEAPATEAPATEAPATEAPATEAPATEAPATEAPATEAPATEAPATEAPKVEEPTPEPAPKNNTGLIIAIVAVVVVVGAGLGIVLGKKKK